MAAIYKNNSSNTESYRTIADRTSLAIDKIRENGDSIKKIEIKFIALPSIRYENRLLCEKRLTITHNYPSDTEEGVGNDALRNFVNRTSLSYSQMIAKLRHNHQYLELTCKVKVIGEKTAPDTTLPIYELGGKMEIDGDLDQPFWDHVFESKQPIDYIVVVKDGDQHNEKADHSESSPKL